MSNQNRPARQSIMFPQGEDLPLFTGQPPTAVVRPFVPQEAFAQPSLIDLRPTLNGAPESHLEGSQCELYRTNRSQFFYPLRDDLNNLSGGEVTLPAGTTVRFVAGSYQFGNKWLVATDNNLYTWTWSDFVEPLHV